MPPSLTRKVIITPGYLIADRVSRGAAYINHVLTGKKGAVVYQVHTGWYPGMNLDEPVHLPPSSNDVLYHSPVPLRDDQSISDKQCAWIKKPCYCDGSGTLAHDWLPLLIAKGSDAIWPLLEKQYYTWLSPAEDPHASY